MVCRARCGGGAGRGRGWGRFVRSWGWDDMIRFDQDRITPFVKLAVFFFFFFFLGLCRCVQEKERKKMYKKIVPQVTKERAMIVHALSTRHSGHQALVANQPALAHHGPRIIRLTKVHHY